MPNSLEPMVGLRNEVNGRVFAIASDWTTARIEETTRIQQYPALVADHFCQPLL